MMTTTTDAAVFWIFMSSYILTVRPASSQLVPVVSHHYSTSFKSTDHLASANGHLRASTQQTKFNNTGCEFQPNFRCATQDLCISVQQVLNGFKDCPDGSDEDSRKVDYCKLGPAFHRCDANSNCITTSFGFKCQCKNGFTGDGFYCEKFPLGIQIAATLGNADLHESPEDQPVHFNVSVVVVPHGFNSNLSLTVMGMPNGSRFNIGHICNLTSWCFVDEDFSFGTYINAVFYPPSDWSGSIPFTIIAEIFRENYWVTGYTATTLEIMAAPDAPTLRVGTSCFQNFTDSEVTIPISTHLSDTDGSEELEIDFDGLPEGFDVSTSSDESQQEPQQQGPSMTNSITTAIIVKPVGEMIPFNITVIAVSREKRTGKENRTTRTLSIQQCPPYPKMSVIFLVSNESLEDVPIPVHIAVKFDLDESPRLLSIQLLDLPLSASLNRGQRTNTSAWLLSRQDLADNELVLQPPRHFSGRLAVSVISDVLYKGFQYSLNSTAVIQIRPVVNSPVLEVWPEVICLSINSTNISFTIDAGLSDQDGSEQLIIQYSIPEDRMVGSVGDSYHGSYTLLTEKSRDLVNVTITAKAGFLFPVEIPVVVMAVEHSTADQKIVFTKIKVIFCDEGQRASAYKALQRTTIVWNITTPIPDFVKGQTQRMTTSAPQWHLGTSKSGSLNFSTVYIPILNGSYAFPKPSNISRFYDRNKTQADSPDSAESIRQLEVSLPYGSPMDQKPQFIFNNSRITSSTRAPGKGQRQAKPANQGKGKLKNPKTRSGKTKRPSTPARAEMDGVQLEQHVSVMNVTEDAPLKMNISVATKNALNTSAVKVQISGLPQKVSLDKGRRDNTTGSWTLRDDELGPITMILPPHFSGRLSFAVKSTMVVMGNKSITARENIFVFVGPVTNGGHIELESPYFEKNCLDPSEKEIHLVIKVVLDDDDGSEELEFVDITGLPKSVFMHPGRFLGSEQSRIIFPKELPNVSLRTEGTFPRFRMVLNAKIKEKETGIQATMSKDMLIVHCGSESLSGDRTQRSAGSVIWSSASRPYLNLFLCQLWITLIILYS